MPGVPTEPTMLAPYRVLDAAQVSDTVGGGRPFTDDDTTPSPEALS